MNGSTRSYEMARRLAANGHNVHIVTSWRTEKEQKGWFVTEEEGFTVHWLPVPYSNQMNFSKRLKSFFHFALAAGKKARLIGGDVVFATSTPLTIALPGVYTARKQRIPMVFEVRDLWPELPIAVGAIKGVLIPAARWLERFAYRHAERIVALSDGMKAGIVRTGYPPEKITVIPNSADLGLFQVSSSEGQKFRNSFDWLRDNPLVLYAGTLGKINGIDYMARLAAEVLHLSPNVRFLVIGDGAEKEKIIAIASDLKVGNKNFFWLPPVAKQEIPAILSAATVATSLFINLPAMWANSANKFFDALAAGTPIAINYQGWQAELLKESGAGIVLSPTDVKLAARDLVNLLNDTQQLNAAGQVALHLAKTRFNRDHLAENLEEVLVQAVQ